jgi:hypothetical protein
MKLEQNDLINRDHICAPRGIEWQKSFSYKILSSLTISHSNALKIELKYFFFASRKIIN